MRLALAALFAVAGFAAASAQTPPVTRTVDLKNAVGATIGQVQLWGAPGGVVIRVTARGLTPGWHGLHLHETANCSPATFTAAGAHVGHTPTGQHGLLTPTGGEAGDLPNFYVGPNRQGASEMFTTRVTLSRGGETPNLLDADGSALVIHASPDDHTSQPIGGSGARIACAVIR